MDFEQMNAIQRRLHNAACVLGADGDEHGFEQLQRDAIAEIERLVRERKFLVDAVKAFVGAQDESWQEFAAAAMAAGCCET